MVVCLLLLFVFVSSLTLTYCYKEYALKKSILDLPNTRSSHVHPTPRGGGVVFVSIFYLFLLGLWKMEWISSSFFIALLGGIPVALIGYCDDLYSVRAQWRILVHIASAIWGITWLGLVDDVQFVFAILLTIWFINLYNFMDGIDGLAASEAVFVALISGVVLIQSDFGLSLTCFGLAFSVFGFLYWNWSPAKIFMGDIGSGFLGYLFSILMWSTVSTHVLPLFFWLILLAVFLFDATYTLLRRMIQRKKWYEAHREHIYQKMVQNGLAHYQMTLIVILVNMVILLPLALYI